MASLGLDSRDRPAWQPCRQRGKRTQIGVHDKMCAGANRHAAYRPALRTASLWRVMAAIHTQSSSLYPYLAPELLLATSAGCWGAPTETQVPELFETAVPAQSVKPGLLMCLSCSSMGKPARRARFTVNRVVKAL